MFGFFFRKKRALKPLDVAKSVQNKANRRLWDTEGSNAASQCPWVNHELRLQSDPASVLHVHMDSSKSSGFLPYTSQ